MDQAAPAPRPTQNASISEVRNDSENRLAAVSKTAMFSENSPACELVRRYKIESE
jgi:hypothetical protein